MSSEIVSHGRLGSICLASAASAVAILLSLAAAVGIGAVGVPLEEIIGIILNRTLGEMLTPTWNSGQEAIVWELRFPRALLAGAVGAGLALAGAVLQSVTRNPLADPHLLGISSGAAFGAIAALLHTGLFLGSLTLPIMAFGGALLSSAIVVGLTGFAGSPSASRLVLTGVAVSFVIMAGGNALIFFGDPRGSHMVVYWMLGSLGLAQWTSLAAPYLILAICGTYVWLKSDALNAMTIGDETAASLGVPVIRFRLFATAVAALLTGVMVAHSGLIGFVGLMIPHIARMIVGGDNARVIPVSAIAGGVFLIWADIVARTILSPEDMPIGVVTGLVGGLFFLVLLRRQNI